MEKNEVIRKIIQELVAVSPNVPAEKIEQVVKILFDEWTASVETRVKEMIRDWEERMPEDKTLYSLGLRRALDVALDRKPEDPSTGSGARR